MFRKAQEEIVGFALIIIVVAVIMLIFLSFTLNNSERESVESYEAESFIQSMLQYNTDCKNNFEKISVQDLIFDCIQEKQCLDGRDSCKVLDDTVKGILDASWPAGEDRPIRGYSLNITTENGKVMSVEKGNRTVNSKGASQNFFSSGESVGVIFRAYY